MTGPDDQGVVLRGGLVHDRSTGGATVRDVRFAGGVITEPDARPDDRIVDVRGLVVAPGLVDLHAHVFAGQDLGVDADRTAFTAGTTTMIDAGSAGAHLIGAFRASTVDRSSVRIRAFLNIASIGATSIRLGGELRAPWYISESAAIAAIDANRDFVVGVKVRASADVGGENAGPALAAVRRVADAVDLPLMVHLGPAPVGVDEIADTLRRGDVLTHAFTGWEDNRVLDERGKVRASIRAARDRGVLLDVGHGMSGFSLETARRMLADGEPPDTISTDIHAYSRETVVDLPEVLSKFLALGMSLAEVLHRATVAPAEAVGLDAGTLRHGRRADIAVFEIIEGEFSFGDGFGGQVTGRERLHPVLTFSNGRRVFGGGRF